MLAMFDPVYFVFLAPAFILSLWASVKVKSTFARFAKVRSMRGITGAQAAAEIMRANGVNDVDIQPARGFLSDHYDPTKKVLRLSKDVYGGSSLSAIGVAAHEAGHALQHAERYSPLMLRNAIVPVTSIGSNLSMPLIFIGFFMGSLALLKLGIVFFSLVVFFQLVTLPVEFNASRRALAAVTEIGIVSREEAVGSQKVLSAAAMTYVAAAITAVLQLVYFLLRSGLLGGSDD